MSTVGQAAGGLVGGIAGFFLSGGSPTGALYGAQIGLSIGGYLDPVKGPVSEGPRLSDLSVQTSTYGAVIPRIYGTVSVTGNVFWLENNALRETVTKKKSGGKGGGSKTTTRIYSYSATFAVGLDDTHAKGSPLVGVRRIWIGPDLFYDAGSSDPDTIAASNAAADGFTFYPGSDSQSPDPRMQAALGVDSTPAYRGLAYIVFYDLPLEKYGNSLVGAQVKAELMNASAPPAWSATAYAMPSYSSWAHMAASPTTAVCISDQSNKVAITHDGITWAARTSSAPYNHGCVAYGGGTFITMREGVGCDKSTDDGETWVAVDSVPARDWVANPVNAYPPYSGVSYESIAYGNGRFCAVSSVITGTTDDGINWRKGAMPSSGTWKIAHNGAALFVAVKGGTNSAATSPDGLTWTARTMAASGNWAGLAYGNGLFVAVGFSGGSPIQTSPDGITWTTVSGVGYSYRGITWNRDHFVAPAYGAAGASVSLDGVTWSSISLPSSQLWQGTVAFMGQTLVAAYNSSTMATITVARIGAGQLLSAIVSSECLQSGLLTAGDIDVSALTRTVRGYRIGSAGSIRSALDPLRSSWPFDVVQRGYKVVFVSRGGASIGTIPAADLDARADGATPGVQITTSREMDSQMPVRVTINHLDVDREYDTGTQYAERLNTSAINALTHDLPIVLTATEAAGKAETLLYLAWLERHDVLISLPPTWAHLEPGDVVGLTTPEGVVSLRITAANYTADGRVECSAKYDNAAIYTPTAVGESGQSTGESEIARVGQSSYELLDIPLVHDAQSGIGFPVVMYGTSEGWRGGVLYQSRDAGATWLTAEEFVPPGATVGRATNTIGAVESRMLDRASILTVVLSSGELYDVTELSMLAGANHFAYGGPGRWEIVAAQNCTLQSGTTYALSNMARGLAGTEWAMALHAVDDALVLLDSSDLQMLALSGADIGAPRLYRAISIGRDFGTDGDRSMTYSAVNLKPLSPVYLKGSRHPSTGDWAVEWTRRTRVGGDWRDFVDADLGESSEAYEAEIYADGSYATVKRVATVATPALTYTASEQGVDFGAIQDAIYIKVRQISAAVGRGYPLSASLFYSAPSAYVATITIPPGSVSAALTDFPLFIDLSMFSAAWWGSLCYRDGRDIRVKNSGGSDIPFDLVFVDAQNRAGYMFVKTSLSNVAATSIVVAIGLASNGLVDPSAPNGRNAVWTNYHRVVTFGHDHADRTGNGYAASYAPTTSMQVSTSSPNTSSHQGVAWDGLSYYVSDTNRLTRRDSSWSVLATNSNPVAAVGGGTNHTGDIEVVDGVLYAPIELYVNPSTYSQMHIARFNAETLAYIDAVNVSAQGHEVSSIAYCPTDGYLYVSSYSDGTKLWKYNRTTLAYVGSVTLSTSITSIQGVTWWNGAFWISSGADSRIYRVERNGTVRGSVYGSTAGSDDFEGVSHTDEGLLVLVDVTGSPGNGVVRTLRPKTAGKVAAVEFSGNVDQFEYLTGLSRYTTWTMGASVKLDNKAAIQGIMTYTVNGSSNSADRATIAYRLSSDRLGLWNDTDTWLLDTISPVVGTVYRINASHNGTSGRKFYRDGTLTASSGSSTARPSPGADALVFGMESWMRGEDMSGSMGFAYLAATQFSDPYIAAEASNLASPSTFYSISE